jgi:hypothetical protein
MKSDAVYRLALKFCAPKIVREVYRGVLGREPDPEGLATYCNQLAESGSLAAVVAGVSTSQEAWSRNFFEYPSELVSLLFRGLLNKEPDAQALHAYGARLTQSKDLAQLLSTIARSQEHWETLLALRAEELVQAIQGACLRAPDERASKVYVDQLRRGKDLMAVLSKVVHSPAHWESMVELRADDLVKSVYAALLKREPDEQALSVYAARLRESKDLSQLLSTIARSQEHWETLLALRAEELVQAIQGACLRAPDERTCRAYVDQLRRGKDLMAVLAKVVRSPEHWESMVELRADDLVKSVYAALLKREPDEQALSVYGAQLRNGKDLSQLLSSVARSQEHWNTLLALRAEELVRGVYEALLNREPDEEALETYRAQLADSNDLPRLLSTIAHSQEHWEALLGLRAEELVRGVYEAVLKRQPDEQALNAYGAQLKEDKDLPRLLSTIAHSQEHWEALQGLRAEELVREVYAALLNREPDEQALNAYGAQLKQNKSLAPLLSVVAQSQEHWELLLASKSVEVVRAVCQGLTNGTLDDQKLAAYADTFTLGRNLADLVSVVGDSDEHWSVVAKRRSWPHPASSYTSNTVVFLHIQKTAGTSVQNMLQEAFARDKIYREYVDTLHLHSPAELSAYSLFAGHFNYDSLAFIPRRKLNLVTFVREPKKRLTSLYNFWRAHQPAHPSYSGGIVLANELPMADFFARAEIDQDWGVWNHMTWAIMGERQWREWRRLLRSVAGSTKAESDILAGTIRPAIRQRLREFSFIGLQEDFNRSILLLFRTLNRTPPAVRADHSLEHIMSTNEGFKRSMRRQPLTAATHVVLERLVNLDNIVYSEAKTLYAEHLRQILGPEREGLSQRARFDLELPRRKKRRSRE